MGKADDRDIFTNLQAKPSAPWFLSTWFLVTAAVLVAAGLCWFLFF